MARIDALKDWERMERGIEVTYEVLMSFDDFEKRGEACDQCLAVFDNYDEAYEYFTQYSDCELTVIELAECRDMEGSFRWIDSREL